MLLDQLKIGISLLFMIYASWRDLKFREVPDKVWVAFAPIGGAMTVAQGLQLGGEFFNAVLISIAVVSALSLAIFYLGLFGGADAKALICLSLTLPTPYTFKPDPSIAVLPLFTLTVFNNAVLTSALSSVAIFLYNLYWRLKVKEQLFKGLEEEPLHKKLIALMTGYKIEVSRIREKAFIYPLEEVSRGEDGEVSRMLKLSTRIRDEEPEELLKKFEEFEGVGESLWVSPFLPFIIYMTMGLIISLIYGDIIVMLVKGILTYLSI